MVCRIDGSFYTWKIPVLGIVLSVISVALIYSMAASTHLEQFIDNTQEREFQIHASTLNATITNNTTQKRLPSAIVIGAKKCSTSAIVFFLDMHPNVKSVEREVHFFDTPEKYSKGLDSYLESMPPLRPDEISVERSPRYFVTEGVPERIAQMNSSIKLVLMVMDPVARLISEYAHMKAHKPNLPPLEVRITDKITGQLNASFPPLDIGLYYKHFLKWLNVFSLDQFLILDGADFIKSPWLGLQQMESFLGLQNYITKEHFVFVETKGFYCKKTAAEPQCMNEFKGRPHPDVDPGITNKIKEFYKPHNEKFFELIGYRFNW